MSPPETPATVLFAEPSLVPLELHTRIALIHEDFKVKTKRVANSSFSNQPDLLLVQGSYRASVPIRPMKQQEDIVFSNLPLDVHTKSPSMPQIVFSESADAWDVLEALIGTIDAPPDWASQHDHYLYDTPKRW